MSRFQHGQMMMMYLYCASQNLTGHEFPQVLAKSADSKVLKDLMQRFSCGP